MSNIMKQRKFYWYMRMYNIHQLIYTPALKFVLSLSFDILCPTSVCVCVLYTAADKGTWEICLGWHFGRAAKLRATFWLGTTFYRLPHMPQNLCPTLCVYVLCSVVFMLCSPLLCCAALYIPLSKYSLFWSFFCFEWIKAVRSTSSLIIKIRNCLLLK